MQQTPRPAEIVLPQQGLRLHGAVTRMTSEDITVLLDTSPEERARLPEDAPAQLTVITRAAVFLAVTRVIKEAEGKLTLAFAQPVRKIQRRRGERRPCVFPVAYRAAYAEGGQGVWHEARAVDISLGGMGLRIPAEKAIPARMELRFILPDAETAAQEAALACSDNPVVIRTAQPIRPMRVMARLAYCRPESETHFMAGVQFLKLAPKDEIRLACFIHDASEAAA